MEHFGVNPYTKRGTKIDSRYYHPRKTTVLSEYLELVEGRIEVVEKIEIVEPSASKSHVPDGFDRLQYLKKLGGAKKTNFSIQEIINRLENGK